MPFLGHPVHIYALVCGYARNAIISCHAVSFLRSHTCISTKLCHTFGSEAYLKVDVQNLWPAVYEGQKLPILGWFYDDIAIRVRITYEQNKLSINEKNSKLQTKGPLYIFFQNLIFRSTHGRELVSQFHTLSRSVPVCSHGRGHRKLNFATCSEMGQI